MTPVPIIDKTRTVGPPKDWVPELDGPCLSIDVFDTVDELTGIKYMRTAWRLEPEDIQHLNKNGVLWLDISDLTGKGIFPVIRIFTSD